MAWATSKNRYSAQINGKNLLVDLFDLPYTDFDEENPLIVQGPVALTEKARSTDLTNVHIIGGLDISKQKVAFVFPKRVDGPFICRSNSQMKNVSTKQKQDVFYENIVYPQGITEIDCSFSISSFSALGKIPETVTKIIVSDALLANIQESVEKFLDAKQFHEQHPEIEVISEKKGKTLAEAINSTPVPQEILENPLISKTEKLKKLEPEYAVKTTNFCDEDDLFKYCSQNSEIKAFKQLDSVLKRKIRQIMGKLDTVTLKDKSGNIVVCIKKIDTKKVIDTLKADLQKKTVQKPQTVQIDESRIQTEDFCNINEVVELCLNNKTLKSLGADEVLIKTKVRKHLKTFDRRLLINKETNSCISCVSRSKVPELIEKVIEEIKEAERKKPRKKLQPKEKTVTTAQKVQKKTLPVVPQEPELTPIFISKYIPKKLWKDICKACGKDLSMRKSVLEAVASVNADISKTKPSCHLQIIDEKNNVATQSSFLRRKSENCVIQSIGTSLCKDNKRIVWSYLPEERILACVSLYLEHTKTKSGNSYERSCYLASTGRDANGEKITTQKIKEEDYYNVGFLLARCNAEINEEQNAEEEYAETRSSKRPRIHVTKTTEKTLAYKSSKAQPTTVPVTQKAEKAPVKENKTEDIVEEKTEEAKDVVPTPIEQKEEKVMKTEDIINTQIKPENMAAVQAIQTYFQGIIKTLEEVADQGLMVASNEEDVAKKLQKIDDARELIVKKSELINIMTPGINDICRLVQQIQSNAKTK